MKTNTSVVNRTNPVESARCFGWHGLARLTPLLLLFALAATAKALDFTYTINNGNITITRYNCSGASVAIPSAINGLPVTDIGDSAFSPCSNLTDVAIPNSVTKIGRWAFEDCRRLTSVTIPDSVTSLGEGAFSRCTSLTNVIIGNSITNIESLAFQDCPALTRITIGNGVNTIGSSAFGSCTSLTSITIPNSVASIGRFTFFSCSGLTNVTIPNSVTMIGDRAFGECTSLTAITVDVLNSFYQSVDGVLFNKSQTTLIQYPGGKAGSYTIPNTVTNIADDAFSQSGLTSITIPDSVSNIGDLAFYSCFSLTDVTIPSSVISIGDVPFANCTSLIAITVNPMNPVYSSMDGVLFNRSQTTLIQCPGSKAGNYTIPSSVTSIGVGAFAYCNELTSVAIPNTVASIGRFTFFSCSGLTNVTIPNSVTHIGDLAFYACFSLTSVTIPQSVTSIGTLAFYFCSSLTTVYFQGNAPSWVPDGIYNGASGGEGSIFLYDDNLTIYHLPGATGWGTTFGDTINGFRPTALWSLPYPVILDTGPNFGVRTNGFGFTISWATNTSVVVEACTNLDNPVWSPLGTNTLVNGSSYFSDPQWTDYPSRFYRLRAH